MNILRTTHAFRLRPLNAPLAALTLLLLALVAPAGAGPGNDDRAPDLGDCQELQVPAGNKVLFHAFGVGVQIYRWDGTSWIFVAPEAVLFADAGDDGAVGIHYAGPTWESGSGSTVVGMVLKRCTPDPDAIPWLLLGAVSHEGPGIFDRVTYLQRVNTVGGKAPTDPGAFPGEEARVPYTADYFFYRTQHWLSMYRGADGDPPRDEFGMSFVGIRYESGISSPNDQTVRPVSRQPIRPAAIRWALKK